MEQFTRKYFFLVYLSDGGLQQCICACDRKSIEPKEGEGGGEFSFWRKRHANRQPVDSSPCQRIDDGSVGCENESWMFFFFFASRSGATRLQVGKKIELLAVVGNRWGRWVRGEHRRYREGRPGVQLPPRRDMRVCARRCYLYCCPRPSPACFSGSTEVPPHLHFL